MITTYIKYFIPTLLLTLLIVGCGENGTGMEPEEPPALPKMEAAQPDFSYFGNAQKVATTIQNGDAFGSAQSTVLGAQFLFALGRTGTGYLSMIENEEAEYKDGKWVWEYSYTEGGESLGIRLVSNVNEDANTAHWEFYQTGSFSQSNVEEFKYMEGSTSLDGLSGDWKIYGYEEGSGSSVVMSYEWNTDADGNLSATFSFPGDDSVSSMSYAQNGSTYTLIVTNTSGDLEIYWDVEQDHGYWWDKSTGEKLCWDSGKVDTACADIGF